MDAAAIHNILILGAGTSGQQIALQFARFGYRVALYDAHDAALRDLPERLDGLLQKLVADGVVACAAVAEILSRIRITGDATDAASDAHLLSESVPENLKLKREVLARFHPLCPPETIFTTNTSYLLPSSLAKASGRAERFAAFHFHVPVWHANAVDVMPHPTTMPEVTETLCELAWRIGQVPIRSRRENPGYVFNTMLHPLLLSALDLAARGIADFEDVDRAWMAITKMPIGPFGIVDEIGLDTVHRILETWGRWLPGTQARGAAALLQSYLDQQRLGRKSNHGFYRYPSPGFAAPEFLARRIEPDSTLPGGEVTARFVPEAVPLPRDAGDGRTMRLAGGAIVVGQGPLALRLVARLDAAGVAVAHLPEHVAAQEARGWLERRWQQSPRPHLFLIADAASPLGDDLDERPAREWFEQRVLIPFAATQAWFRQLVNTPDLASATLLAISRLGGKLGFDGRVDCAAGGGLAGLVKSVADESMVRARPGIAARLVDFAREVNPDRCLDLALGELAGAQSEIVDGEIGECLWRHTRIEAGYRGPLRYAVNHRAVGASSASGPGLKPQGTWLVSGGSGGITMQVALALAQEYGLSLHVLGRTKLPETDYLAWPAEDIERLRKDVMRSAYRRGQKPNEAWQPYARGIEVQQALHAYRGAGVAVEYHACDVADRAAVEMVMQRVRDRQQSVTGVLHGAGAERSTRLESKDLALAETILRPKTLGTWALIEATRAEPLEWFIAFGSLAGRFGSPGQVDYAMANELMAKMVTRLRQTRPGCCGVTIHWPGWQDVGMAAHPENRYMLQKARHQLLPVAEGVRHFLREIRSGGPDAEVVIVSPAEMHAIMQAEDAAGGRQPELPAEKIAS